MVVRGGHVDDTGFNRGAVWRMDGVQRANLGEYRRESADAIGGDVKDDEHRRGQVGWQMGDYDFQRFKAARRRSDDNASLCAIHTPHPVFLYGCSCVHPLRPVPPLYTRSSLSKLLTDFC
jgi:hypothetical protein